jgi:hypothetical protein
MTARRQLYIVLPMLWMIMAATFAAVLPHVQVDRVSESLAHYFKLPYQLIQQRHIVVLPEEDPFPENGPQAVYPPAAIAYFTGSLFLTRAYQFLFSMIVVSLSFYFLMRLISKNPTNVLESTAYGILCLAIWFSMPLSLVYPIQINGMTAGFACLLLGVILYADSRLWGTFCFGWAFTFKGQYLAMLPGFIIYLYFIDIRSKNWPRHLWQATCALLMFFVPKTLILACLFGVLGMFQTSHDFFRYAFDGPHLIYNEFTYIVGHFLGRATAAAPEAAIRRALEFSGFGILAWAHIGGSVLFCMSFVIRSIWKRIQKNPEEEVGVAKGLTAFAWGGLFYWINYLFFYRFPYWYNVFAVIFMNITLATTAFHLALVWLAQKTGRKTWSNAFLLFAVVAAIVYYKSHWRATYSQGVGDALLPYEWMKHS